MTPIRFQDFKRNQDAGSCESPPQSILDEQPDVVLLMDKPSPGLAPKPVMPIGRMTSELNRSGINIVLVEQNAQMALRLAQYGYLMETGEVVLEAVTRNLMKDNRVVRAYLGGQ